MAVPRRADADATVDVLVIGAGPAGCAAAATLAADGRSVLVVDRGPADSRERAFRVGEGAPPGLDRSVDQVFGPGAFISDDHLRSFANRSVWGSDQPVDTDFMFNPFGPGWHLDRVAFDARLRTLVTDAGARLWEGTVRSSPLSAPPIALGTSSTPPAPSASAGGAIDPPSGSWTLAIETAAGGREVEAAVVCDASGRRAAFARRHGGRLVTRDRLVAAVAVYERPFAPRSADPGAPGAVGPDDDRDTATTIEAVEGGWWYTAAIPGGRRVVALFSDGDLLPIDIRTREGFARELATTHAVIEPVAGSGAGYELRVAPTLVAAGTSHLERPAGPGWLATGDAAACFDPLSSQGTLTAVLLGRTAGDAAISLVVDPRAGTDAYEERYRAVLDRFLEEQRATYALERRWPDAPFWSRRHAATPPTA